MTSTLRLGGEYVLEKECQISNGTNNGLHEMVGIAKTTHSLP